MANAVTSGPRATTAAMHGAPPPTPSESLAPEVVRRGLSAAEARELLDRVGPNELTPPRRATAPILLATLANPLVLILVAASVVSAVGGQPVSAAIIVVTVVLSAVLDGVQTHRSHRAAERLRESVAPTATALRDGQWLELPRREIVPGDVVRLTAGDQVPADAWLITARDLHVHQAALTGEPLPAEKEPSAGPSESTDAGARNLVFLGTSVVSGTATALVTATGSRTAFGGIAAQLAARAPETEFDRGVRRFGALIGRVVVLLVLFLMLVSIALHRPALESLLFAVALAVGLVPEFLPMITSVTLANGAVRMARERVIVKHLAAIQNLGSVDVLCSDKTGTLTSGEMHLVAALDVELQPSARVLHLAWVNSAFETGIRSPLDHAILDACAEPRQESEEHYEKLDEIPFDFERRRLSIVVRRGDEMLFVTKGAPESVTGCCTTYDVARGTRAMDDTARERFASAFHAMSGEGLRVIAVASKRVVEERPYSARDETELSLAGYLTFADPPLPDTPDTLAALKRDGVEVKILTGDEAVVTRHVCAEVGLDAAVSVGGAEIDRLGDAALAAVAERTSVFTRVSPAQKNRIILALKSRGHVVGFLGDGINDAPSLHTADVGISVASAVDVARDAADVLLLEHDLRVLHTGIIEGRKAFGNVMKYLLMGTSSSFGNMFSMAIGSLFLPFLPMLPTQILLNNFLYDVAQLPIPSDSVDDWYIRKPRRWDIGMIRDFMLRVGPVSSVFDILTFAVLLFAFHASAPLFHTGWFVESLLTQTLVLFVIRTAGNPLRSRPSRALLATMAAVATVAVVLPWTPLARMLGFVPLPGRFLLLLVAIVAVYLVAVEVAKRRVLRKLPL